MTKSITVPTGWKAPSSGGGTGGAVTSVDARTGVVVLTDLYTNKTGDTMTGLLTVPNIAVGATAPATGAIRLTSGTTAAAGIQFGADVGLYRSAVGTIKTDGRLDTNVVRVGTPGAGFLSAVDLGVTGLHRDRSTWSNLSIMSSDAQAIDKGGSISLGGSYTDAGAPTPYAHIGAGKHSGVTGEFGGYLTLGTRPQGGTMTERLRITEAGLVQVSGSLALGVTPPATGAVRLTAGTTAAEGIQFGADTNLYRSAAGVLKTDGAIAVGAGNVAATGDIRAANNTTIIGSRNAGNTADVAVLATDATNNLSIAGSAGAQMFLKNGTTVVLTVAAAVVAVADAKNISFATTTGTKLGTATTQKLAFWNATPVVQPAGTPAAATDAATTQALINDLRTKLMTIGLIA